MGFDAVQSVEERVHSKNGKANEGEDARALGRLKRYILIFSYCGSRERSDIRR